MESLLIKISGELLSPHVEGGAQVFRHPVSIDSTIAQIKVLGEKHHLGLVIGGGNFFRGDQQGKVLGSSAAAAHQVGMLATLMNGLLLQDLLAQKAIPSRLESAFFCPQMAPPIAQESLEQAKKDKNILIFAGGTGAPFVTTDTAAVIRALQIGATTVFKATKVGGVYTDDPAKNPSAQKIDKLSHAEALKQNLKIVDRTALTLAQEHGINFRIFDISAPHALIRATEDSSFGSAISA